MIDVSYESCTSRPCPTRFFFSSLFTETFFHSPQRSEKDWSFVFSVYIFLSLCWLVGERGCGCGMQRWAFWLGLSGIDCVFFFFFLFCPWRVFTLFSLCFVCYFMLLASLFSFSLFLSLPTLLLRFFIYPLVVSIDSTFFFPFDSWLLGQTALGWDGWADRSTRTRGLHSGICNVALVFLLVYLAWLHGSVSSDHDEWGLRKIEKSAF